MEDDQAYRRELLAKQSQNMHHKFFEQDLKRQHIVVPIFSKLSPKEVITPFRNTECAKPSCIYHIDDLVAKYIDSGFSKLHGFICHNCDRYIYLKNFHLDYSLKKISDQIWQTVNKPDKIICKKVTIMRDGHWEPHLPEYLKYLDKNLHRSLGIERDRKVQGFYAEQEGLKTINTYERPPPLANYNKRDFKELLDDILAERARGDQVMLERDGIPVTKDDILRAENDDGVSFRVVSIFCNYLNQMQKIDPGRYNLGNKNRCFTLAINVANYDKFYKKANYQLYFGFKNPYRKNKSLLYHDYDKLILIFNYDSRWITTVVDLRSHAYYISDFLTSDLSCVKYEELLDLSKSIVSQEFGLPYSSHEFTDDTKISYLNDCGLYALNYVYKVSQNSQTDSVRVKAPEKELFRKQLIWLLLKLRLAKKKKVQMFSFPENDENVDGDPKLTAQNLQKLERQYQLEQQWQRQQQEQAPKEVSVQVSSGLGQSEKSLVLDLDIAQREEDLNTKKEQSLLRLLSDENKGDASPTKTPSKWKFLREKSMNLNQRKSITKANIPLLQQVKGPSVKNPQGDPRIMQDFKKGLENEESMIELRKDQLKDLLDDFKNEVLGNIKNDKIRAQENQSLIKPQMFKRHLNDSSSSSDDDSDDSDVEGNYTTLPRIQNPGQHPYGMQNPYMPANPYMNNPYLYGNNRSESSSYDSMSDVSQSQSLSSNFGGFSGKFLKGKKPKPYQRDKNESIFDYSAHGKRGSGKGQQQLYGINEVNEDGGGSAPRAGQFNPNYQY